jgi:hypothetical protein
MSLPATTTAARTDRSVPLHLYRTRVAVPLAQVPSSAPVDHMMAHDLDRYVAQRIPAKPLRAALWRRVPIEVHGHLPHPPPRRRRGRGVAVCSRARGVRADRQDAQRGPAVAVLRAGPRRRRATDRRRTAGPGLRPALREPGPAPHAPGDHPGRRAASGLAVSGCGARDRGLDPVDDEALGGADTVVFGKIELISRVLVRQDLPVLRRVTPHYSS